MKGLGGAEETYGIDDVGKPGDGFGLDGVKQKELDEPSKTGSENEIHGDKGECDGPKGMD